MAKHKSSELVRCNWVTDDPLYIKYHDEEWGRPEHDNIKLFEMLCLEGQQAGISWITVLKKRENYQKEFHNFDPFLIVKMNTTDINNLLKHVGIIRHKSKLDAIIINAHSYIKMKESGEDFSTFIWDFVNNEPIVNKWKSTADIPTKTSISIDMSKALKQRKFKFIGPTICYAFMQACGLVNDHLMHCSFRNQKEENLLKLIKTK